MMISSILRDGFNLQLHCGNPTGNPSPLQVHLPSVEKVHKSCRSHSSSLLELQQQHGDRVRGVVALSLTGGDPNEHLRVGRSGRLRFSHVHGATSLFAVVEVAEEGTTRLAAGGGAYPEQQGSLIQTFTLLCLGESAHAVSWNDLAGAMDHKTTKGEFDSTLWSVAEAVVVPSLEKHQHRRRQHGRHHHRNHKRSASISGAPESPEDCEDHSLLQPGLPGPGLPQPQPQLLNNSQREQFVRDGFIVVKDVVPINLVDDAKRMVNHHLGKGPEIWKMKKKSSGKEKPSLGHSKHESILNLVNKSQVGSVVECMIGKGNLKRRRVGQLAIRFPVDDQIPQAAAESVCEGHASNSVAAHHVATPTVTNIQTEIAPMHYHIDGDDEDQVVPFTCLAKIPLSDQSLPGNGNFTVFPGSHRNPELLRWYHQKISGNQKKDRKTKGNRNNRVAVEGGQEEDYVRIHRPPLGNPLQVCMKPGDCALIHPHLAHSVGINTSPNIRYSIIFRLSHRERCSQLKSKTLCLEKLLQDAASYNPESLAEGGSAGSLEGIQMLSSWE